jgi:hypothetical protein
MAVCTSRAVSPSQQYWTLLPYARWAKLETMNAFARHCATCSWMPLGFVDKIDKLEAGYERIEQGSGER